MKQKGGVGVAAKKGGLGKGLSAIFMENATEDSNQTVTLKLSEIQPNRSQPRKEFDDEALGELADSIQQHGVLQPLLVRPLPDGGYQIVAGERRFRASRMAGITEVPVVIRELSDEETMELALIENLQREDLSPLEEAEGYRTLMEQYQLTQEEVAKIVGKSRPAVANALRLLWLPQQVVDLVQAGELSAGHARALLSLKEEEKILETAQLAAQKGLSVRALESLVKKEMGEKRRNPAAAKGRNHYFDEVELALSSHLGKKVKVTQKGEDNGVLQIEFYSLDDLASLCKALEQEPETKQ